MKKLETPEHFKSKVEFLNFCGLRRPQIAEVLGLTDQSLKTLLTNNNIRLNKDNYGPSNNLNGKKFGRWTVQNHYEYKEIGNTKQKRVYWLCVCDCGTERLVEASNLMNGTTTGCGCGARLEGNTAAKNKVISHYKVSAKRRGYSWELTDEEALEIMTQNCHYCGQEPSNKHTNSHSDFVYSGIDRKDNTKGYTLDNCVPSCSICNKAKLDLSYESFISWIHKASNFLNKELTNGD